MINMFNVPGNSVKETKIERIYGVYKHTMFAVAVDVTKNLHDAEDVVNESMMKVMKIQDRIDEPMIETKRCKNLIITITKNTAIDFIRKTRKQAERIVEIRPSEPSKSVEELYLDMESYNELLECIGKLDEKYRDVLRLKLIYNLSSKETGIVLNINEAAVNTRFARAKKRLGELLRERMKHE